jgi:hypothetical protein
VLCRLGHNTAHFNVGNYRRLQKEANEVQDAAFFDSHNQVRRGGVGGRAEGEGCYRNAQAAKQVQTAAFFDSHNR